MRSQLKSLVLLTASLSLLGGCDSPDAEKAVQRDAALETQTSALFVELDQNLDGVVTRAEVGDHHIAHGFDHADVDGDGSLTESELVDFSLEWFDEHPESADAHANGEHAKAAELSAR